MYSFSGMKVMTFSVFKVSHGPFVRLTNGRSLDPSRICCVDEDLTWCFFLPKTPSSSMYSKCEG